jgi:general secretion pathway protein D
MALGLALVAVGMMAITVSTFAQVQQSVGTPAIYPNLQQVETGPILDVIPVVLSDGYTINLTLIPSVTEFGGYDTVPSVPTSGLGNVVMVPTVLPYFNIRQVITTINIWDNQTVALGGLISSQVNTTKDKVPFLGDLPLAGRLFQSQSKSEIKGNLMIFVTATMVDPAGNRVHKDDELPFAQNSIPQQMNGVTVRSGMPQAPVAP